jgi:nucleotidyltransferase/DNA polymerase involved in DNA repair
LGLVSTSDELIQVLAPLLVSALRTESDALAFLSQLGIENIGELVKQPRSTLRNRFGANLIERLDQAHGIVPKIFSLLAQRPNTASLGHSNTRLKVRKSCLRYSENGRAAYHWARVC